MQEFQIAVINYPPEYSDLIKSFNELHDPSVAGLEIMTRILEDYNPAHYTIWKKRWEFLTALDYDIDKEIEWINSLLFENPKTYQIWNYRQQLLSLKNDPSNEISLLNEILIDDHKNYHAWSYRQWLIKKFNLSDGELEYTKSLISQDPYNNSAWNHRHFIFSLLFPTDSIGEADRPETRKEALKEEIEYVKGVITQYPDNESPWNYYRAFVSVVSPSDLEFVKSFEENRFAAYTMYVWTKDSTYLDKLVLLDPKRSNFWSNLKDCCDK